jgi:glycosyltransferase involved in cell wall biosynthesis
MQPLVSILTPCYNGEKYIKRYAEALLKQTYSRCQLIFMNDGSKDDSERLIMNYRQKFVQKGFEFEYHYHENVGLGTTIAEGIKYVKGDYVVWPDVDDVLPPNSIEKKVNFLEANTQYGVVRTNFITALDEPENIIKNDSTSGYDCYKEELFMDYLVSKNMWLQPGCYMIRMRDFLYSNPTRYIYPTRTGQDWQMLLPVLYNHKCGYLDDRLYIYIVRSDSMSHLVKGDYNREKLQLENYEDLIINTLEFMDKPDKAKYIHIVHQHYLQEKLSLAFRYSNRDECRLCWGNLDKNYRNFKLWVKKTFSKSKIVKGVYYRLTAR